MKTLIFAILVSVAAPALAAQVQGYVRKDGTYVAPHMRSNPNSSTMDNYSTQGNVNPYTGQQGTVNPYGGSQMYSPPPSYTPPPAYQPYAPYRP